MQDDQGNVTEIVRAPRRVLQSDPHDFAGLYLRHRSSFTLHARRYLRDARDADEVVQEAFLRLFLALPELETELQALAYCRRTITNLAIDRYRADARRPKLVDLETAPVDDLAGDDPGDPVVRAEDAAVVRDALAMLPPLQRAALVKREIEEKPLSVIAGELEIPEDNVKHVLFRARRALRKLLAGTSLAPGVDAEGRRTAVPRVRSGGAAAFLVLLALGLGSGPDLEAVPVVGVDLPDVIGVTRLVDSVGEAFTDVVEKMTSSGSTDGRTGVGSAEPGATRPGSTGDGTGATGTADPPPTTTVLPPGTITPGLVGPRPGSPADTGSTGLPMAPGAGAGVAETPAEAAAPGPLPAGDLPPVARPPAGAPGQAVRPQPGTVGAVPAPREVKAATPGSKKAAKPGRDTVEEAVPQAVDPAPLAPSKADAKLAKQQAKQQSEQLDQELSSTKKAKAKVKVQQLEAPVESVPVAP